MAIAEFPEKTFESSYFAELSRGLGGNARLYSPSQVFEKLVGFDAAVDPAAPHVVWKVLNVPRPRGVSLLPDHWRGSTFGVPRAAALPRNPISLILQYKRPEFLRGNRAKQWGLWHSPYYRFQRDSDQHAVLKRLEANLVGEAVVRYASPAFHTLAELDVAQLAGTVIEQTGHVAPLVLANHKVWTYQAAGKPGRGNPRGRWHAFEPFPALFDYKDSEDAEMTRSREITLFDGLRPHLATLARVAASREPTLRRSVEQWRRGLRAEGVPDQLGESLADFVTVQSLLTRIGARWMLGDGSQISPIG